MKRSQTLKILGDLQKKMVILTGPRQVGKTWLSKEIMTHYKKAIYLNYDNRDDKEIIHSQSWLDENDLIIFDELHKMPQWKTYIKGVYDKKSDMQHILVTGSAKLDTFRKMGDALTGRFFKHRLHPFSIKEISSTNSEIDFKTLFERGGFPEPLLAKNEIDAKRWRQDYLDSLIREEILDFNNISQLSTMNTLIRVLQERVASPLSYASLARDLNSSIPTIKKYINILEALFIIFKISPFSRNIARSILKEPKIYFYDWSLVNGDDGLKYENMLAVHLLKHCHAERDQLGKLSELYYLRTKEQKEVDFCLVENQTIHTLIEAKYSSTSLSPNLAYFSEKYKIPGIQLVYNMKNKVERTVNQHKILSAKNYLNTLII